MIPALPDSARAGATVSIGAPRVRVWSEGTQERGMSEDEQQRTFLPPSACGLCRWGPVRHRGNRER